MTHKTQITLTYSQLWEIQKALSRVVGDLIEQGEMSGERMGYVMDALSVVRPEVDRLLEVIENEVVADFRDELDKWG